MSYKVFVISSFDTRFDKRFADVIAPAIARLQADGKCVSAFRVDQSQISDSVLTEIIREIQTARLVFADITALDELNGRPIRNANALYELGIAHAVRLPEEVLIFRSDSRPLDFDIANVRVKNFDPDGDPVGSQELVVQAALESSRTLGQMRYLAVERAAQRLDARASLLLTQAVGKGDIQMPSNYKMLELGENIKNEVAISRLLGESLLTTKYIQLDAQTALANDSKVSDSFKYTPTPFGIAVAHYITDKILSHSAKQSLADRLKTQEGQPPHSKSP